MLTKQTIEVRRWNGANRNAPVNSTPYWQVVQGGRVVSTHDSRDQAERRAVMLRARCPKGVS